MSFKETEASVRYEIIDGKRTAVITPECIVTLTNTETGIEYNSDAEAQIDIDDPTTETKKEHIKRDVEIKIVDIDLGSASGDL
jgi:hypothetical protein|tara:strand:+ start:278 stop:526 length:249 start_codon:yes stop_codon:yes gene_type:complete